MDVPEVPENTDTKVIQDSDVKLFRARTYLGEFPVGVCFDWLNPVEVQADGRRLGWAALEGTDAGVLKPRRISIAAEIVLDYATPERLEIQNGAKLYAHLSGIAELDVEPHELLGRLAVPTPGLTDFDVITLQVSTEPAYEGQPALGEAVF